MARKKETLKVEPTEELKLNEELPKEEVKEEPKKQSPKKENKPKKASKMVHIDDFIEAIRPVENLSIGKAAGFRAYMLGNHYLPSLEDFIPHLETYVGKEVK